MEPSITNKYHLLSKECGLTYYTLDNDFTWRTWVGARYISPVVRFVGTPTEIAMKARRLRDTCPLAADYTGSGLYPRRWLDLDITKVLRADPGPDLILETVFAVATDLEDTGESKPYPPIDEVILSSIHFFTERNGRVRLLPKHPHQSRRT